MDTLTYDARGLVEVDGTPPGTAEIADGSAVLDARGLTTRKINAELRRLIYRERILDVTVRNPGALHSLGVGILQRWRIPTPSECSAPGLRTVTSRIPSW